MFQDINHYLSFVAEDQKNTLQKVREDIHNILPTVIETISYQIPTFKHPTLGGIIAFGAFKTHLSLFLMSKKAVSAVTEILHNHSIKGTTVYFSSKQPITKTKLKKIIALRLKENEERILKKKTPSPKKEKV